MARQAEGTGRNWYALHTYSGYEKAVEKALRQRIESMNMQDYIFDVSVPQETRVTIRKGKPYTEKKCLFPGYVLVEMTVTDESWYVVRNTPNVTGFVGAGTVPVPVTPEEFGVLQKRVGEDTPKAQINFSLGELVQIIEGPFAGYEGQVSSIDETRGKVKILVSLFGRETPVELSFVEIKKK